MPNELTEEQYRAIYGAEMPPAQTSSASLSDLSAEIVTGLTANAEAFAATLSSNMRQIDKNRTLIREHLLDTGQIHQIPAVDDDNYSIAAVDGGVAVEPLYAVDLLATVAVAVEGTVGVNSEELAVITWADTPARHVDNKRIARMHMLVDELRIVTRLTHDVRLIDGSHMNPFIELSKGLSGSDAVAREAIRLIESIDVPASIEALTAPNNGVASLAKGDTGSVFSDDIRKALPVIGEMPGITDKALAALVLDEGEVLLPHRLGKLAEGPLNVGNVNRLPRDIQPAAAKYNELVNPLRESARDGRMRVTFFKPPRSVTAVRVQFCASDDNAETALRESLTLISRISAETFGPDMQEPFPQYAADLAAKSVSVGIDSLRYAIIASLPPGDSEYAALLARNYRT